MGNLVEQARAAQGAARERAAREYREILSRMDALRRGDAERLAELLRAIGKSLDDAPRDAEVLGEAAALEAEAARFPEADAARIAAAERALASATETERIAREREAADGRLMAECAAATAACRKAERARSDLSQLRADNRMLFGQEPAEAAEVSPVNLIGSEVPVGGSLAPGVHGG
jgi:hypothetical protein